MKIGVLTLPFHTNYGGILQAYALKKTLENMGYEVEIMNWNRKVPLPSLWKRFFVYLRRFLLKLADQYDYPVRCEWFYNQREEKILKNINVFVKDYLGIKILNSIFDFPTYYDAIVVGSDQIWRHCYGTTMWSCKIENLFLSFTKNWNVKRIAYAASFGTDKWEYSYEETIKCKSAIADFDAVSVREESGVSFCQNKLCFQNVQWVLDPTMLLSSVDYIQLFEKKQISPSSGSLFVYFLDSSESIIKLVEKVSCKLNLKVFNISSNLFSLDDLNKICPAAPVESWIRAFYDAEFVITDSFHACVFSILFNKPFRVVYNNNRGNSRVQNLLSKLGLIDVIIEDINNSVNWNINYDWSKVNQLIEKYRVNSLSFLNNAFKKTE